MDGWIHHYWPSACLKTTGRAIGGMPGVGVLQRSIYTTLWGTTRLKSPVNANGSGAETTCMLTAHSRLGTPRAPLVVSVLLKIHPAFAGEFRPGNARQNKPKSKQTPLCEIGEQNAVLWPNPGGNPEPCTHLLEHGEL
jgi:hypothetical protein